MIRLTIEWMIAIVSLLSGGNLFIIKPLYVKS